MAKVRPLVFSGPSGSGKSTLVKELMKEFEGCFAFSISHTTRQPRTNEVNGREYHFVTREQLKTAIDNGEFIETAEFSGNLYGTSKKAVEDVESTGRICILDIDMQGVKSMKETNLDPLYLFVEPPSMAILEERLRSRGTETEDHVQRRLQIGRGEIEFSKQPGAYDHVIVNDNLNKAYSQLKTILTPLISKVESSSKNLANDI